MFGCTGRKLVLNGIAHPEFYGDVNRDGKFRYDPGKRMNPFNEIILIGNRLNTVTVVHICPFTVLQCVDIFILALTKVIFF